MSVRNLHQNYVVFAALSVHQASALINLTNTFVRSTDPYKVVCLKRLLGELRMNVTITHNLCSSQ